MYKNIVPGLITFETSLNKIKGFILSDDFGFYNESQMKATFHYKITRTSSFVVPKSFNYKVGNTFIVDDTLYYFRRLFPYINIEFSYNFKTKEILFNDYYGKLPFKVGGINPVGELIFEIIKLDLFLNDYVIMNGSAFEYKGKVNAIVSPSMNGKTYMIKNYLEQGASYIAENLLVLSITEPLLVYPTAWIKNFGRESNKALIGIKFKNIITKPLKLDNLYGFIKYSKQSSNFPRLDFFDFLNLCGRMPYDSEICKILITFKGLNEEVYNKILKCKYFPKGAFYFNYGDKLEI